VSLAGNTGRLVLRVSEDLAQAVLCSKVGSEIAWYVVARSITIASASCLVGIKQHTEVLCNSSAVVPGPPTYHL
jgi:hypothetical protein